MSLLNIVPSPQKLHRKFGNDMNGQGDNDIITHTQIKTKNEK